MNVACFPGAVGLGEYDWNTESVVSFNHSAFSGSFHSADDLCT